MPFTYQRTVRFQDTDAAGVVYFANVLPMCHEAYEASLAAAGINLKDFFGGRYGAIPIAHAEVDFFRPMFCGDQLEIQLTPRQLAESEFDIAYEVFLEKQVDRAISKAKTRHVCIDPTTRARQAISPQVADWLHQWAVAAP